MPVDDSTSAAISVKRARTASASSGSSWFGPKTGGKNSGCSLPSMTLQSVTASGPPRR